MFQSYLYSQRKNEKKSESCLNHAYNLINKDDEEFILLYYFYKITHLVEFKHLKDAEEYLLEVFDLQTVSFKYKRYQLKFKILLAKLFILKNSVQHAEKVLEEVIEASSDYLLIQQEAYSLFWKLLEGRRPSILKKILLKQIADIEEKIKDDLLISVYRESNEVTYLLSEIINENKW